MTVPLPMPSNQGVNMALIHPNEWQIMLKSERWTRNFQMACIQHADSFKNQGAKEIINLFSAFYACISKSFRTFAPDNNNRVSSIAEIGLTFPVGVQRHAPQGRAFFEQCLISTRSCVAGRAVE